MEPQPAAPPPPPASPVALARERARRASGLAHLVRWMPLPRRRDGTDDRVRALFDTVATLNAPGMDGQSVVDCLDPDDYHALLMSYFASEARPGPRRPAERPGVGGGTAAAAPIDALRSLLEKYQRSPSSPPYKIRKLCYSPWSPATLIRRGHTLFVACRGSHHIREWWLDGDTHLQSIDEGGLLGTAMAHSGFLRACRAQLDQVLGSIEEELLSSRDLKDVVFCGHSLGGAVAQLLALAYAQQSGERPPGGPTTWVRSFGCPRIGCRALRLLLEWWIHHERLFLHQDVIAGVPRQGSHLLGWPPNVDLYAPHHASYSWRLDPDGVAAAAPARPDEPQTPLNPLLARRHRSRHKLSRYAQALTSHRDVCKTIEATPVAAEA